MTLDTNLTHVETAVPGIFAAGDSVAKKFRLVTTALAEPRLPHWQRLYEHGN